MRIAVVTQLLLCFVASVGAQLTVTPLPNILFQNNSGVHNIVEQSVIWLYCTANSTTATITWTKNGVTLVNDPAHIRIRSSNSGMSATSSLVVDNFQSSDNGNYVCQARDGMMTVNSSTLSLTASTNTLMVGTHPTDNDDFPDNRLAIPVGNSQVLRCVGTGSSGPPSVVWVRNGEQVINGGNITITEGTTVIGLRRSSNLQITNFALSDAGVYQCIFTEGAEVITTTPLRLDTGDAMLERVSPRVIVLDPPEKLVLEARASGGYRQLDWQRNGSPFSLTQGQFIVMLQEFPNFFEIFVRDRTTTNDLGVYEVDLVINTGSQVPEVQFAVTPYSAPTTMNLNGTVTVQEGESVNITCISTGNPIPTITWYLGPSLAPFSQSDSVETFSAVITGPAGNRQLIFTEGNITSVLQITNAVYPAHDGQYTCVGLNSNRAGENTSNATITVQVQAQLTPLPDILFQNNSGVHNIVEQSVIWLYCTANSVNATITWTKDGVTLVNDPAHIRIRSSSSGMSTTSSLVVDNFQTSDNGSYVCQARDGVLTTSSSTLSLTASTSTLSVVTNPTDNDGFPDNHIAVPVGNSQVLRCVGTGSSSPPSVVWVRNGEQVINGSRITITEGTPGGQQISSDLQISNFTLSDAGVYQCIFTEGAEVITTTPLRLDTGDVMLERVSPRVIVLDPPEKLILETRALGGYRQLDWQRNGEPFTLVQGQPFTITLQEFLNFFEIFVREPTTVNDLGVYDVDLILNAGQAQVPEVDFIVTQYNTPTSMNLNSTVTVQEGDSVNIACNSTGNPVPTISWYLGASLAPFSQSDTVINFTALVIGSSPGVFSFTEGNITSVLQITNAAYPAHDGEYTCVGLNSNRAGDNTSNATITVQVQVMFNITFPPDGQAYTVNENDPVTFTCSATGIPPPEITWIRSGVVLDESVDSRISVSDPETVPNLGGNITSVSRNLTMSSTRGNDSSIYTCVASNRNAVTPNVTQDFRLFVNVIPSIFQPPENLTVVQPQSATFICNATAQPRPEITWWRMGSLQLMEQPGVIEISTHTFGERENVSNLTIIMADPSDAGGYVCMATNVVGQDTTAAELTVHVIPNITFPLNGFTYTVNENDPVTFTCSATAIPPPEITWMKNGALFDQRNTRVTLSGPTIPELFSTGGGNIYSVSRNVTLDNTMDADSGTYTCVASNGNTVDPTDVQNFELFVRVAPTILEPPENLTVVQPQSATFLCNATARPRPEITWWRMGSQLMERPGVTEISTSTFGEREIVSNLTIVMADRSDAGGYACNATNAAGQDTAAAEVAVHVVPNITFPVDDGFTYTVNETDPVTFTCSATGIPPPEITWMRNGVVLDESIDSRISLSDPSDPETVPTAGGNISFVSRSLTISNTRDNDSGTYTCVASNGNAVTPSVTQNFNLFVNVAPTILEPPENLTVVQPQSATFLCNTTARPRPEITWWRMGIRSQLMEQPGVTEISTSTFGEREILSNLTIIMADPSDAGGYVCMATNVAGQDTAAAELTVHVLPNITFPVDDGFTYTVNENDPVTFTCSATGIPPPEITWMRNGAPFDQSNTRVTLSDPTMPELFSTGGGNIYFVSHNLTLDNTMDADSGTYTCVASNGNDVDPTDVQNFELFVRVAPTILEPPENLTVVQPQSATFLCNATARPRPEITWWRMGSQLMEQPGVIEISTSTFGEREIVSNLTIIMADPSDAGEYVCMATNTAGQDTADSDFTVHVIPNVTFPVDDGFTYTVNETYPVTFTCSATGIPPPEITWMRNGVVLDESVDSRISLSDPSDPETVPTAGGIISSVHRSLTISNTRDNDSGTYACVASNGNAVTPNVTQSFELFVNVAPIILEPPENLTVVQPHSAIFLCNATARPRPEITWWRMGNQLMEQPGVTEISTNTFGEREIVNNLIIITSDPSDAGGYVCMATNAAGQDTAAAELTVHVVPNVTFPVDDGFTYTVNETYPVTFTCSATGIPPPEITWMRNGAPFDQSITRVTFSDSTIPELFSADGGIIYFVSRNMTLDNSMDADSGTYTCVASNGNDVDPTDMQNFELFVRVAPTILELPENLTVVQPQPATFFCNATARPRPEITWWRMGSQLIEQPGVIEISISTFGEREIVSNLTIIMADPSDAGGYVCMATNAAGQDTAVAELTVNVIPEIIFPNDSSPGYIVNVTDPVTFVCTATGIPPPTIRWFRDGVLLSSRVVLSEPSQTTVPAPMGTGMIYQVERTLTFVTTDSDADTYTCEASNMNVVQSATAQNFTLFVQVPPIVISLAPDQEVIGNETGSTTLSFRIDNAAPLVLLQDLRWFYAGNFSSDPSVRQDITNLTNRTTNSMLTFSDFANMRYINLTVSNIAQRRRGIGGETDEGRYFLTATNPAGVSSSYTDLVVFGRPLIFIPPVDQFEINNGSSAVFQCEASAVPNHTVFWNFTNSDGSTQFIINTDEPDTIKYQVKRERGIGAGFGELTICDVRYRDRGRYTCTAMNSLGTDVSNANLTVHVYPIINNVSSLTEVNVSRPATLVCLTTGFPLPSISWQKEGEEVMLTMDGQISTFSFNIGNGSSSFESSGFRSNGSIEGLIESMTEFNTHDLHSLGELGVVGVLSFDQVVREDTANYTCTAANMLPQTTTLTALSPSIPLVVLEMPNPPVSIMVFGIGARWLALRWRPSFDGNRPITSFVIYCQNINQTTSFMSLGTLQASNLMFRDGNFMYNVTTGILPFTNYNFIVQACNVLGCGNASQPSPTAMTLPDVPTAPQNVTLSNINQTSIMVAWEEPTIPHGILGPYIVSYTGTKSYNSTFRDTGSQSVSGQMVVLTGLTSDTDYSIVVMATNTAGFRNSSNAVVGTTLPGPPPPISVPPRTGTQVGGSLTFTLTIARASNLGGQISHYQVIVVLLPRGVDLADLREPDMQFPTINSLGTYSDINCGSLGTSAIGYITAEFGDNLFPNDNMFIVGDPNQPNDRPNNYTNGQLCSATKYTFFVRAYTVNLMQQRGRRSALAKRQASVEQRQYTLFSSTPYTNVTTTASESTALFQLRLKPVRECLTWVDERRTEKFREIVSAVVQQVQMSCSCSFTEANIRNNEFSCRSIANTVVFRAEIGHTRAEDLLTLVSAWAQSGTSIVVDSTRLDIDPTCPTQLGSLQDDDCELSDPTGTDITSMDPSGTDPTSADPTSAGPSGTDTTSADPRVTDTSSVDPTGTVGGNVATFAALGGAFGIVCVLLIISSIIIIIFVVQRKRKHRTFSPTDETYEIPELPVDDATVKANPARSENVITSSNPAYGHFRISRQENDTKEDEEEDHTYEPLPFDTPRQ